jgi:phosphopantetheinyl transferase (holo-ACP synthase)
MVGNDIVDLHFASHHPRFGQRILAPEEREWANPKNLWHLWACKEAAFKMMQRKDLSLRFIPNRFVCNPELTFCQFSSLSANLSLVETSDYIHATAFEEDLPRVKIVPGTSPLLESIEVRGSALSLLQEMGYEECAIADLPPNIYQKGNLQDHLILSLSHDGRYLAAAISQRKNPC